MTEGIRSSQLKEEVTVKIYRLPIMEREISFDELLKLRPDKSRKRSVILDPPTVQTIEDAARIMVKDYNANFRQLAQIDPYFSGVYDRMSRQFDFRKVCELYLSKEDNGILRIRNGHHRSVILATLVLEGRIIYQPVRAKIECKDEVDEGIEIADDLTPFAQYFRQVELERDRKGHNYIVELSRSDYALLMLSELVKPKLKNSDIRSFPRSITRQLELRLRCAAYGSIPYSLPKKRLLFDIRFSPDSQNDTDLERWYEIALEDKTVYPV